MLSRYILNLIFSSLFSFYFSSLFVSLIALRVKNMRLKSFLFLLPLLKVTFDLFSIDHALWAPLNDQPIFNGIAGSRALSLELLFNGIPTVNMVFTLHSKFIFSMGDFLVECWGETTCFVLALIFLFFTALSILTQGVRLFQSYRFHHNILRNSTSTKNQMIHITNALLPSPFVIGLKTPKVVFSKQLFDTLSKDECEAILSHEKAHIQWADNYANWILSLIDTLFWFIPFKKCMMNKALFLREIACDTQCKHPTMLAQALKKNAAFTMEQTSPYLTLTSKKTTTLKRVQYQLKRKDHRLSFLKKISYLTLFCGSALFVLLSRYFPF